MSIDLPLKFSSHSHKYELPETIEDVEESFEKILDDNDILALLALAEEDERRKIIDESYNNLHFVIDVHDKFSASLASDKNAELLELIKEDAMALIAARSSAYTNVPGISNDEALREIQTEFTDHANIRDINELVEALRVLNDDEEVRIGIEYTIDSLPPMQREAARRSITRVAEDPTETTLFLPAFHEEAARKTGRNFISFIERFGQSVTLDPSQIEDTYLKGGFKYASSKQENIIRRTADGDLSKFGKVAAKAATSLSKRFRS